MSKHPTIEDSNKWIYYTTEISGFPRTSCYTSVINLPLDPTKPKGFCCSVSIAERELVNGKVPKEILLIKLEAIYLSLKDLIETDYERITNEKV